jgi:hypothetical protein
LPEKHLLIIATIGQDLNEGELETSIVILYSDLGAVIDAINGVL